MPMQRVVRPAVRRHPVATSPTPPTSPRDLAVARFVRRDLAVAAAEALLLRAELALLSDDPGGFTRTLRRLTNPSAARSVDVVICVRLWRQLKTARRRGWSAESTADLARRSWPDEEGRVDLLLDALAAQDQSTVDLGRVHRWAQRHQATRYDTLVTAAFVDLWLTDLSSCDPSEVAGSTLGVRDVA